MHELVELDRYFKEKRYDETFLEFLSADKGEYSKTYLLKSNDEKLVQLYNICIKLYRGSENQLELCEEQLKLMNRIAESQSNWIIYPLYKVAKQFIEKCKGDINNLENCGRIVHRSFNLCLNDRNPIQYENRNAGSYSFANLEFYIYHKLNNRDMMKNLVKVLQSRCMDNLESVRKIEFTGHAVNYFYYLGEYYGCYESDFKKSFTFLYEALLHCRHSYYPQVEKILTLLIPFSLIANKWYPNFDYLQGLLRNTKGTNTPEIITIYKPLVDSFLTGNLSKFNTSFSVNEIYFLKKGVYVAVYQLKELVLLKFIKKCCLDIKSNNNSIVPLKPIAVIYSKQLESLRIPTTGNKKKKKTQSNTPKLTYEEKINDILDELECALANLITKGYIKGYLSHSNRCIVLSKKDAFPRLARSVA
ncbi:hypothetical protein Kpol_1010p22 [Vanderwaltozyma polyspora DSM 70294]|uniref:PCI domain-containing protein n=1 Tax=Vanderwaltozyma polyspora (strain ATCC 22028 / DSM 70294 / BCRC 21397 / CBS 2163 / NBRC 10782 / NRRL Y-8283 / UCD 57-17) TaxID=436907 RepID=A7TIG9_VANPO|nr:uncharacterized protein Kpol_1010p22 [Vanderwaltozyma polyspora DSM 70294]EDO17907.1 hypothetical protein Kpol_1010p22 [Vanderwaltozyma polyspora DSM 70294]